MVLAYRASLESSWRWEANRSVMPRNVAPGAMHPLSTTSRNPRITRSWRATHAADLGTTSVRSDIRPFSSMNPPRYCVKPLQCVALNIALSVVALAPRNARASCVDDNAARARR